MPYTPHGSGWNGWDCFGLVERWHKDILGIDVRDRQDHEATALGLSNGHGMTIAFERVEAPIDHSLALMKASEGREIIKYGHCGMIFNGKVYHVQKEHGFHCQSLEAVRHRITDYRMHVDARNA